MKTRTAWILVAAVTAVALGAAAVGALALVLQSGPGSWGGPAYLYVGLEGELPEAPSADLGSILERTPTPLRTLVGSFHRAAKDPKVSGVMVRVGLLDAGWGKVQEIRGAIERFRESGKPVYAFLEFCGNKEYYLVSAASKIYVVPTAMLNISGLAAEVTFLRQTLDKLGIQAEYEMVGRFKNAPNQFTETGFTPPHREQMEAMLDSLFHQYVDAIAEGRGKTPEEVRALIDAGPYDAKLALEAGLVDELLYSDQIEDKLEASRRVSPSRYARSAGGVGLGKPKLALIFAVGDIMPGESQDGPFGGAGFVGSDTVASALRQARQDSSIEAIVLRINSPGGSGTASDVIWREVSLARQAKPVVVSMSDLAASGGYYIAMGSSAIVAQPGTLTGSIGVYGGKFNLRGFYDKIGLSKEILTRGRHAAIFSDYKPWDAGERERFRALQESFYQDFIEKAAEGRATTADEIEQVAQGRVWTGEEAHRLGLVDVLGGLEVALDLAKDKAGLAASDEVSLVVLPEPKGLLETLFTRRDDTPMGRLSPEIRSLLRWAELFGIEQPLARLPFDVRIQ